jgi:hypothetical protein
MKKSGLWAIGALFIAAALVFAACNNPSGIPQEQQRTLTVETNPWARVKAWHTFDSLAAAGQFLAEQDQNDALTPYGIKFSNQVNVADFARATGANDDKLEKLFQIFGGVYVALDLSQCVSTETGTFVGNGNNNKTGTNSRVDADKLVLLVLPDTLVKLGDHLFFVDTAAEKTSSLTAVRFPAGLTNIGNSVFYGCASLVSVSAAPALTIIGAGAFYTATALASFPFPAGLSVIGNSAFENSGLTAVSIPAAVPLTTINASAFKGCASLRTVTLPEGVKSINADAFTNCPNLETVSLPASISLINPPVFTGAYKVTFSVAPGGTWETGANGKLLINYEASQSAKYLYHAPSLAGDQTISGFDRVLLTFKDNTMLTGLTFAEGVSSLAGTKEFSGCTNLRRVDFPSTLLVTGTNISTAFPGCTALESLTIRNTTAVPEFRNDIARRFPQPNEVPNLVIYVPAGLVDGYQAAEGWKDFNIQPIPGTEG